MASSVFINPNNAGLTLGPNAELTASASAVTSTVPLVFSGGSTLDGITTANMIDQRNGTTAQAIRIYKTTDAGNVNFERLAIGQADASAFYIINEIGGTGVARGLFISTPSTTNLTLRSGGSTAVMSDVLGGFRIDAGQSLLFASKAFINTAPTIASGFGTTPSIPNNNGSAAFTINVGTGGTATDGVITMPTAATGWVCHVTNLTSAASLVVDQTAGTSTSITLASYSRTTGLLTAFNASDVLRVLAIAY